MSLTIPEIVDRYLDKMIKVELNYITGEVVPAMRGKDNGEGWTEWIPIPSTVTESELAELEQRIGYPLPDAYKLFLQYKFFYELMIDNVSFNNHIAGSWQEGLLDLVLHSYPKEWFVDKGYIPFANYDDWGLLCFDAGKQQTPESSGTNYAVCLWDHEKPQQFKWLYPDFLTLMQDLDKRDEESSSD